MSADDAIQFGFLVGKRYVLERLLFHHAGKEEEEAGD